jgi:ABC-2 type transport system permease protein
MNAVIESQAPSPSPLRVAPHPTHKFRLLLRREFWEHKGGFFWAPIWAGAISLVLTAMALIVGEVSMRRAVAAGQNMQINGVDVSVNGLDLGVLASRMDASSIRDFGNGIDFASLTSALWPMVVLGFVVFFFCLGSLYDERKDRSVLFWKSLPLSDTETVLSKAASALVVAPALAVAAAIASMLGFLLLVSVFVLLHHGNPHALVWGPGSPLKVAASLAAAIPVYALWALPAVGWLMFCSAWAKSKPFLWAILIPVFSGILISWFNLMNVFHLNDGWYWKNIVFRGLFSVFPGSWYANPVMRDAASIRIHDPGDLAGAIQVGKSWALFGTADLWIGALAGAAMIYAAIRLRRWRDDN